MLIKKFLDISNSKRINVTVAGDCIIDDYYYVNANRVSPEFPVPVMKSLSSVPHHRLSGGAANVAHQLKHFNCNTHLMGFLNLEASNVFKGNNVNCDFSLIDRHVQVPIKRRFYQNEFPLCRWDIEEQYYGLGSKQNVSVLSNMLRKKLPDSDVIILSDYDKGFFTDKESRTKWLDTGITTIVDPKNCPAEEWEGCTIFKPNSVEAEKLSGYKSKYDQINYFLDKTKCKYVVITNGGDGVYGWNGNNIFEYVGKKHSNPRSVIGAGDNFVAILALSFALGMDIEECAEIAFQSGALYVGNIHNEPLTPEDLLRSVDPIAAKYLLPPEDRNFKLVMVNGCFDLFHSGHLYSLNEAKKYGDKLIVVLNSDASVNRLKGKNRPILPIDQRMKLIASLECVDYVASFEENTPLEIIEKIKPDVICKGSDYKVENVVRGNCPEVKIIPLVEGLSTTSIIRKITSDVL